MAKIYKRKQYLEENATDKSSKSYKKSLESSNRQKAKTQIFKEVAWEESRAYNDTELQYDEEMRKANECSGKEITFNLFIDSIHKITKIKASFKCKCGP
jgi:hypothetical protein